MAQPILVLAAGLAASLTLAPPASAADERNTVFIRTADGAGSLVDTGATVAAKVTTFSDASSSSQHLGEAFAPTQTLRASTLLSSTGSHDAKTESGFSKTVLVGGAAGTVVPANISLRLDGVFGAGGAVNADTVRLYNSIDVRVSYRVFDLDVQVCGEGCRPLQVASFGYDSRLTYDFNYRGTGKIDLETNYAWSWSGATSGSFGSTPVRDYEEGLAFRPSVNVFIDTGPLAMSFDTVAGHTLLHVATMDTFAQAYGANGSGSAWGDFASTFDADLSTPLAGISFIGETPGVLISTVPEPTTWALWLAGLVGMGAVVRRRPGR